MMQDAEASLTWLHISDIHFGSPGEVAWRDAALRALLKTVETEGNKGWRPAFIFFTGDVTFSGQSPDYDSAQEFFDQLLDKTGLKLLKKERLFIIPGNHDAAREETKKIQLPSYVQKPSNLIQHDDWIEELIAIPRSEDYDEASDRFFRDEPTLRSCLRKFQGFQHFSNDYLSRAFSEGKPYLVSRVDDVNGFRVGIVGFNTAWLAGEKEKNYRQLLGLLPITLALQEIGKMGDVDLTFAMLHHPIEDLIEHESDTIKNRLREYCDFVLCGHRDYPELAGVLSAPGHKKVAFIRVGPTYNGPHFPNRFYFARFSIERKKKWLNFNPFQYSKNTNEWIPDGEAIANLQKFYGSEILDLGTAAPILTKDPSRWPHLQSPLSPVTSETLKRAEQEAEDDLQELERLRECFGPGSREYSEYCNARSFLGNLPEWRHLYMSVFGAFPRPKKEARLLEALDKNLRNLDAKPNGLLFHVISGDSGSGKSTLAKLIIRRLFEKHDLERFPHLVKALSRLRVFEISKTGDWDALEDSLRADAGSSATTKDPIFMLFFDDLFAELDQKHVQRLFEILQRVAEAAKIYFLVTSPSWLFPPRVQVYRRDFGLVDIDETQISGLDLEDRESLKAQYRGIYRDKCRADLIKMIEDEKDVILIKLALHQNLHYSDYLKRLFVALQREGLQRYSAALLLSSILSRFYVHFSLPLIQEINQEFTLTPQEKLPETAADYESFAVQGFKLFRIRKGTHDQSDVSGLPDTIAPLHDRIAQVIYSAWGNDNVPLLGLKLWELGSKVYEIMNRLPGTKPILANIFRGMLRMAQGQNQDLELFVSHFGPVQQGRWALLDYPEASYRWITYSQYKVGLTENFLQTWSQALHHMITRDTAELAKVRLLCCLLNPRDPILSKDMDWMEGLPALGEEYFPLLHKFLDESLRLQPLQVDLLSSYLCQLKDWLYRYPKATKSALSYRYLVISSLVDADIGNLRIQKRLNEVVKEIVKSYLVNISYEHKTYRVLGANLFRNINWSRSDAKELSETILPYVQDERNWFRPVLFERLLDFIRVGELEQPSGKELFDLLVEISLQIPKASSLTFVWQKFFEHLRSLNIVRPLECQQTLTHIRDRLFSESLEDFMKTAGYPDFIEGFLKHVNKIQLEYKADQLARVLRPLVELHTENPATKYAFEAAIDLTWLSLGLFVGQAENDMDRQLRLCLAEQANLPLELVLKDFTELLVKEKISIPTTLCFLLTKYLEKRRKSEVSVSFLENCKERIYPWLRNKMRAEEDVQRKAVPVFLLACSDILFSPECMKGLEGLAQKAVERGHISRFIPFKYLDWWLKEEVTRVTQEQRVALLDAFWKYTLELSNLTDMNKRFVAYDEYFLFLLSRYEIEQDVHWWGRAVQQLVKFYAGLLEPASRRSQWVTLGRKKVKRETMAFQQRNCLEKIMDTILGRLRSLESELRRSFVTAAKEALRPYEAQGWAKRWLDILEPDVKTDHTQLFLEYLNSAESRLPISAVYDIRNHATQWSKAIKRSGLDPIIEVGKIWKWLDRARPPNTSAYLIAPLFESFPQELEHFECGHLVRKILESGDFDFGSKSVVIRYYIEWLEKIKQEIRGKQIEDLERISNWFLQEILSASNIQSIMYGFQTLFSAALKYDLKLDPTKARNTFFRALEACIDLEGGGALARDYFAWLFHRKDDCEIEDYLEWIKSRFSGAQSPYVLAHLVQSLPSLRAHSSSSSESERIWCVLKLLMSKRLDSPGTTAAMENFFNYLVYLQSVSPADKASLNKISQECYQSCLESCSHPRVIYLMLNLPILNQDLRKSINCPSPNEIMVLWRKLPSAVRYNRSDDSFVMLIREIDGYLKGEGQVREVFRQDLLNYIKERPGHWLSPELANILIDDTDYIDQHPFYVREISSILLDLIKLQDDLEEVAFLIRRCLNPVHERLLLVMSKEEQVEYEASLIESLGMNLHKPFFEACLFQMITSCTRKVHCERLTRLVRKYLEQARKFEEVRIKEHLRIDSKEILENYSKYVKESETEMEEALQRNVGESFLVSIQMNAKSVGIAKCFSALLNIFGKAYISQDVATSTLKALILSQNIGQWADIMESCFRFRELFGSEALLCPTLSIEDAFEQLRLNGEGGLVLVQQRLRSELSVSKH
ncbi:metallophosphoesterase [Candidatus Bathyarchaeota archaeon]|nr:metallophosphoesterase [Candidatus Bathyarchaeota archaeon]